MRYQPFTKRKTLAGWRPLALYAALLSLSFSVCGAAYIFFIFFPGPREWLLPISFPTLPSGMTFDALHDLDRIVVKQFERLGVPWYVGFLLSAALLLGLAAWLLRRKLTVIKDAVLAPRSAWLYVLLAGGLAAAALFIDAKGFVPRKWVLVEEVLEMNTALSLLFAACVGVFFAFQEGEVRREA